MQQRNAAKRRYASMVGGTAATVVFGLFAAVPAFATTLRDTSAFMPVGSSLPAFIGLVIRGILGVVGVLALLMFVYGGVLWMTAAGNQQRLTKAKNTLIWSAIGLVITLGAASIVGFILHTIGTG